MVANGTTNFVGGAILVLVCDSLRHQKVTGRLFYYPFGFTGLLRHVQLPDFLMRSVDQQGKAGKCSDIDVFQTANHVSGAKLNEHDVDNYQGETKFGWPEF